MTWTLVHESALLESTTSPAHISFWTYFLDTFLPSVNWTTQWDGPYNATQNYITFDHSGIDGYGNALKFHFLMEFEWSSGDCLLYRQPLADGPNDRDNLIVVYTNSSWAGLTQTGDYLQIWKNDLNGFFVRKRYGDIVLIQPPDTWMMENVETQADGNNAPYLWNSAQGAGSYAVLNRATKTIATNAIAVNYLQPTCGRYRSPQVFMTNLITMSEGDDLTKCTHINTVSDDTLVGFWNGGSPVIPNTDTRTIEINGTYYIEAVGTSASLLFNTGAVNPT